MSKVIVFRFSITMVLIAAILSLVPRGMSFLLRHDKNLSRIILRVRNRSTGLICKKGDNDESFDFPASWLPWLHWLIVLILAVVLLAWPTEMEVFGSTVLLTIFASMLARDSATAIFVTKQKGESPTHLQSIGLQSAKIALRPWEVNFGNVEPGNNAYRFLVVRNSSSRDKHLQIQSEASWLSCGFSNQLLLEGDCAAFSTTHILLRANCVSALQTHQNEAQISVLVDSSHYTLYAGMRIKHPTKTDRVCSILISSLFGIVISLMLTTPFAVLTAIQTGQRVFPFYFVSVLAIALIYCLFLSYGIRVQETINYSMAMVKAITFRGLIGALLGILLGLIWAQLGATSGAMNLSMIRVCSVGLGIGVISGASLGIWRLQNVAWHPEFKNLK
ncbi:MAG: hypothetical protein M9936_02635 [Caldilinea sp.]|nr:hypothetical protein [Caldilinea sp.]MCB0148629.1 hypothetical protein [Caldilineaceae bacterium]MCB9140655.1 hypothetical protein [Anaerolineales bacterium]MCB0049028.1 hypothetical protein [Caldilinea sp.]MCB9120394.1 hypothetical protein [Caldilineaceae bacterium]